jgi:hypothetical protein
MTDNQQSNGVLSQQGLYLKYRIEHTDGGPMDPNALYFVLRYDEDSAWSRIGRETLWAMCKRIEKEAPTLVAEIRERIKQIGLWRVFSNDVDTFVAMDLDDLPDAYQMHYGDTMEGVGEELSDWVEVPGDRMLRIWVEEDDYNPEEPIYPPGATIEREEGRYLITARARDWAKANGRGFLCSTEI